MKKPVSLMSYRRRIKKVYLYLSNNLDKPLDIKSLAKIANFSSYHFHHIYRTMVGETVAETYRRLRLERAADLITKTSLTITYIALETGYETPQAFTRAFKAQFMFSPTEYRKKCHDSRALDPITPSTLTFVPIIKETFMQNLIIEQRPITVAFGIEHIGPYHQLGRVFEQI